MSHAPTRFLVARNLLSEGLRPASAIAEELELHRGSVHRALQDLHEATNHRPDLLVEAMLDARSHPTWNTTYHHAPNPKQWQRAYPHASGLSGEHAAEALNEGDLVSDKHLIYIQPSHMHDMMHACERINARLAPASMANLVIRVADAWLGIEEDGFVERGQRYYDYATSKHMTLRRWRPPVDLLSA